MALSQRNFEALQHFAAYAPATVTATGVGSSIDLLGYDGDVVFVHTGGWPALFAPGGNP